MIFFIEGFAIDRDGHHAQLWSMSVSDDENIHQYYVKEEEPELRIGGKEWWDNDPYSKRIRDGQLIEIKHKEIKI